MRYTATFGYASKTRGNVLFMILIAVALLGALTVAVSRNDQGNLTMNREQTDLNVNRVVAFAMDVKRASENLIRAGNSESSLSFAHHDLTGYGTAGANEAQEVFHIAGGGAGLVDVPPNINNGDQWEFYGYSAAPGVGDADMPELMLVLPNVSAPFCEAFNKKAGLDAQPNITGTCPHDTGRRFNGTFATAGAVNALSVAAFARVPAPIACVRCGTANHIYYVLIER